MVSFLTRLVDSFLTRLDIFVPQWLVGGFRFSVGGMVSFPR